MEALLGGNFLPLPMRFALNYMCVPNRSVEDLFGLADELGLDYVEIRNDLDGQAIADGTSARDIQDAAARTGIKLATINTLQRFNEWNSERESEAKHLIDYATDCGAAALVLVPTNDGTGCADGERQDNLRRAMERLGPLLDEAKITGLVEPLGFSSCALRQKSEAVNAITELDATDTFSLVHDTFHHHVAGEADIFPQYTGLVHLSGVCDADVTEENMQDAHRELIDERDRIDNVGQIDALEQGGYEGLFSFEPFAQHVHELDDPASALRTSIEFLRSRTIRAAA